VKPIPIADADHWFHVNPGVLPITIPNLCEYSQTGKSIEDDHDDGVANEEDAVAQDL
jgi:hypothetical protein